MVVFFFQLLRLIFDTENLSKIWTLTTVILANSVAKHVSASKVTILGNFMLKKDFFEFSHAHLLRYVIFGSLLGQILILFAKDLSFLRFIMWHWFGWLCLIYFPRFKFCPSPHDPSEKHPLIMRTTDKRCSSGVKIFHFLYF